MQHLVISDASSFKDLAQKINHSSFTFSDATCVSTAFCHIFLHLSHSLRSYSSHRIQLTFYGPSLPPTPTISSKDGSTYRATSKIYTRTRIRIPLLVFFILFLMISNIHIGFRLLLLGTEVVSSQ